MADVNQGIQNIIKLGLPKQPCPLAVYQGHLKQILPPFGIMSSENWQGVAVSQDGLNAHNGHPHIYSLNQLFDWSSWFFDQQLKTAHGFMGHELDSLIYVLHHSIFWRTIRALALKHGRMDVVAKAELMILVLLVHSACVARRGPIKVLSAQESIPRPGAGYFHAEATPSGYDTKLPLIVGLVGQRSFGRDAAFDQGWWSSVLSEALGMMPAGDITKALRAGGYDAGWGLTAGKANTLKGLIDKQIPALVEAFGWLKGIKCGLESKFEWRTGGSQAWLPWAPSGSTAPVNYRGVVAGSGEQRILCANNGERNTGSGDTDIGPSTTTVSGGIARTVRDDIPAQAASCPSISGNLVARGSWGPSGHRILNLAGGADGASEEDVTEDSPLPPPVDSTVPPADSPRPSPRGGGIHKCAGIYGWTFGTPLPVDLGQ